MAIFMKYEGIDGESEVRGRTGFIELLSADLAATRSTGGTRGGARGDAEVQVKEIGCTKRSDSTTALLFKEAVGGAFDRKVDLDFIQTGPNNKPISFLKVRLEGCGISSIGVSGSAGDGVPLDSFSLNFTKITIESMKVDDKLTAIPFTAGFDLDQGAPV